jgi:hypothetical protein
MDMLDDELANYFLGITNEATPVRESRPPIVSAEYRDAWRRGDIAAWKSFFSGSIPTESHEDDDLELWDALIEAPPGLARQMWESVR